MTQIPLFFNTTNETGKHLAELEATAEKQNAAILEIFKKTHLDMLTPIEVHSIYCATKPCVPITSIRRAITNLTNAGYLIKTSRKKMEVFGHRNYCWQLSNKTNN